MKPACATLFLCLAASPALADDVRDFNTDTPGKAYTPFTVPRGYVQVETDIFHITETDGVETIQAVDPVFKYGLTTNIEFELQTAGYIHTATQSGHKTIDQSGYGDITPEIKWNIIGNDGGPFVAALKAGIKIPTATPGIGNGAAEYYVIIPTQTSLPAGLSLQVQEEIDLLKNQNNTGKYFSYAEDVSLSRTFGKTTLSFELYAQSGTDRATPPEYTADLGLSYEITPTMLISLGTYFALNRYAPSVEAYSGFGIRF